jgi:putative tryptophan/tyrosine transport system substrate-binding protein
VEAGGLLACGPDRHAQYRRAVSFVDAILHGASPAELPVQHTPVEVYVNQATARALGIALPESLLAAADHLVDPAAPAEASRSVALTP